MTVLPARSGERALDLMEAGARALRQVGIEEARAEARLLLRHAADLSTGALIARPEQIIPSAASDVYRDFIRRRMDREPVAYILGAREFWSLTFEVSADVLIPRPDSETLIEAALAGVVDRSAPLRVLDLGTGSGCLLLALLSELPGARGLGIDVSDAALAVARRNAENLGLSGRAAFTQGDWTHGCEGSFDIIVSNPPYIPEADISSLARDVAGFEPQGALSGGPDGLGCYRAILADLPRVLGPSGVAFFELGTGQAEAVGALAREAGLTIESCRPDLAGHLRCLVLRYGAAKKSPWNTPGDRLG